MPEDVQLTLTICIQVLSIFCKVQDIHTRSVYIRKKPSSAILLVSCVQQLANAAHEY